MTKDQIIAAAKEVGAQQRVYKHSPGLDHFLLETDQLERFYAIAFEEGRQAGKEEAAELLEAINRARSTK